jgi:hypothetical protein
MRKTLRIDAQAFPGALVRADEARQGWRAI